MSTRENSFDKLITTYFDRLWANEAYLGTMGGLLKQSFAARAQWNKNLEQFWSLWQLPNQEMQQRTLHGVNTLLTEARFEQEEVNDRLAKMESDLAELKDLVAQAVKQPAAQPAAVAKAADQSAHKGSEKGSDKSGHKNGGQN